MMGTITGFTRQEAAHLTGLTFDQVEYLDRSRVIVPMRIGTGKRRPILYSWNQLIQLVICKNYKDRWKTDQMRVILDFIQSSESELRLGDRVAVFNNVSGAAVLDHDKCVADLVEKAHGIKLSNDPNEIFDLSILPPMKNFVDEILDNVKKSEISEDDPRLKNYFQFAVT